MTSWGSKEASGVVRKRAQGPSSCEPEGDVRVEQEGAATAAQPGWDDSERGADLVIAAESQAPGEKKQTRPPRGSASIITRPFLVRL